MATCNFPNQRNSVNFPVFNLNDDVDGDPDVYSEDKEYYISLLRESLENEFAPATTARGYHKVDYYDDGREIYDGDDVADVTDVFTFAGSEFEITYKVVFHSGYYEGFTLDYELKTSDTAGEDYLPDDGDAQDLQDTAEYLEDVCGLNPGLAKMLARPFIARVNNCAKSIRTRIDNVFAKIAPHNFTCIGVFSNGEAIYEETAPVVA